MDGTGTVEHALNEFTLVPERYNGHVLGLPGSPPVPKGGISEVAPSRPETEAHKV